MKPDEAGRARLEVFERAHLRDPADSSHTIHRYAPSPDLGDLVRRYWVPVWSVPPGQEAPQRVLQYPVALLIVTDAYARFTGVARGISTTTLTGDGWGVGVLFQPAAGFLVSGGSMARWTDRHVELGELLGPDGSRLAGEVRAAMARDPHAESSHRAALDVVEGYLRPLLPVDDEGLLVNGLVAHVEEQPEVTRVAHLCDRFAMSERALQRLTSRRLGITPKWLIQRRRLHEAAERLRRGDVDLAGLAAELGYADQAHLTRDVRTVTGWTPGRLAARYR